MSTEDPFRLSDDFDSFVDSESDPELRCRDCGELVSRDYLIDGVCIGCHDDHQTGHSAHVAGEGRR